MRTGVTVQLSPTDRKCLQAIIDGRNSPQKHVWRAMIVVGTADGLGTAAIMRMAGVSKTAVWRWQERFMSEGVDGLLRDKTRPARLPKIADATTQRVVTMTLSSPPGESTVAMRRGPQSTGMYLRFGGSPFICLFFRLPESG